MHSSTSITQTAPEMVVVPEGRFLMGGIPEDKFVTAVELPQHEVVLLKPFALSTNLVTRREWRLLMESPQDEADGSCPVVNVTFPEVLEYLRRLSATIGRSYRLPTESEWEYACRADSTSVFHHANDLASSDANFLYNESGDEIGVGRPTPVGSYPANAFGIHDLLGNVCEWTADLWHSSYNDAPTDGSAWVQGGKPRCRTIRGGGWDHLPRVLRASWRDWASEEARWDNLGFRVALTL